MGSTHVKRNRGSRDECCGVGPSLQTIESCGERSDSIVKLESDLEAGLA